MSFFTCTLLARVTVYPLRYGYSTNINICVMWGAGLDLSPFFFISKNDIYTKGYSMLEKTKSKPGNTRRRKQRKKQKKEKTNNKLITKRKRTKERRERITSRESPSPRSIKKSSTKRCKHLITGTIQIFKSLPILFPPNTPKDA